MGKKIKLSVIHFQNVFPIKTIQIIENNLCENNTQFPSTFFFYSRNFDWQ
jgi:hypothetical protein